MPLYEIAYSDERPLDPDPFECTDDVAAMQEAALTVAEMLKEYIASNSKLSSFAIEVRHDTDVVGSICVQVNPNKALDEC